VTNDAKSDIKTERKTASHTSHASNAEAAAHVDVLQSWLTCGG